MPRAKRKRAASAQLKEKKVGLHLIIESFSFFFIHQSYLEFGNESNYLNFENSVHMYVLLHGHKNFKLFLSYRTAED